MRRALERFAAAMESKLRVHDRDRGKQGWRTGGEAQNELLGRLREEVAELSKAIGHPLAAIHLRDKGQWIRDEACDVANFAMMIFDETLDDAEAKTCLEHAAALVDGPRRADYGHPHENHSRTAAMWSAYLGIEVTHRQVCMMMSLMKISRDKHRAKQDNLDDICGWTRNAEIVTKVEGTLREAEDLTS